MNKIKEVASLFGVEIGEEFEVVGNCGRFAECNPYHFDEEKGLLDNSGSDCNTEFHMLMVGKLTIKKIPFVPKHGDVYYFVRVNGSIDCDRWDSDSSICHLRFTLGDVFRSIEQAKLHKEEMIEKMQKAYIEALRKEEIK